MKIRALSLIIFLLIVFCTSCSATGKVDCQGHLVYDPDDFTLEQQEWINNSATRWNKWVGYKLVTTVPGDSGVCVIHAGSTEKPSAIGETHHPTEVITIDVEDLRKSDRLDQAHFEGVAMHEIGHVLGYGHIESGKALMAPAGELDFTELDRLECIKHDMCHTLLPPSD